MGWISKIAKSADLASGMMDRVGSTFPADIEQNPEVGARAYARVVYRCSGCPDQEGCAKLQAENAHLDGPPSCCRNADLLMATRS